MTDLAMPGPPQGRRLRLSAALSAAASLFIVAAAAALWLVPIPFEWQTQASQIQELLPLSVPLGIFAYLYGHRPFRTLGMAATIAGAIPLSLAALLVMTWTSDIGWSNPTVSRGVWAIVFVALVWSSVAVAARSDRSGSGRSIPLLLSCASVVWALLLFA